MANGHGGHRTPSRPAQVSGPGKFSRRTDGGPAHQQAKYISGLEHGAGQEAMAVQRAAPLAAAPEIEGAPIDLSGVVPMGAPTNRPDEPVTAGAPMGPGPGPEALSGPFLALPPDVFAEAARRFWVAHPSRESLRMLEMVDTLEAGS